MMARRQRECLCSTRDPAACLRERAPWVDDDETLACVCACHGAAIDLARADLEDDSEGTATT